MTVKTDRFWQLTATLGGVRSTCEMLLGKEAQVRAFGLCGVQATDLCGKPATECAWCSDDCDGHRGCREQQYEGADRLHHIFSHTVDSSTESREQSSYGGQVGWAGSFSPGLFSDTLSESGFGALLSHYLGNWPALPVGSEIDLARSQMSKLP